MSNLPLGEDLKKLFEEVTSGKQEGAPVRAILVQNDGGVLRLVESLPEESTDKDDFSNVLGKLFAKEPSRPGYALYRLDSKSPAGLFEWLNCAYRPEGAKVREKMQYTITQASLLAGLSELHFLETVYGATAAEFAFPSRLRNQRKHDYQNPQLSTAGKKPAEAAGTGTAGRRTFEATPSPIALPKRSATADKAPPAVSEPTTGESTSSPVARPEQSATAEKTPPAVSEPTTSEALGVSQQVPPKEEPASLQASLPKSPLEEDTSSGQAAASAPLVASAEEREEPKGEDVPLAQGIESDQGVGAEPLVDKQALANGGSRDGPNTSASEPAERETETVEEEEPTAAEAAPASSLEPAATEALVTPAPAAAAVTPVVLAAPAAAAAPPAAESAPKPSSTSTGAGTGPEGLETEREKNLASLKSEESRLKNEGTQGGSHLGFPWQQGVEAALLGLKKEVGSPSEANLVLLKIDLAGEQVVLANQPQLVQPSDLGSALPNGEPCYAFYAHPDAQTEDDEGSKVALIYICPLHSTIRQRMLFSANLAITANRAGALPGLSIQKRLETADTSELTTAFLADELLGASSADQGQTKTFSRPKRPGRK